MRGRIERPLGLSHAVVGGAQCVVRAIERLLALIQKFVGRKTARDEGLRTIKLLLREDDFGLLLRDIGVGFVKAALCLLNLRLGLSERSFDIAYIHPCEDLAWHNIITFVRQAAVQPAQQISRRCRFLGLQYARCRKRYLPANPPDAYATSKTRACCAECDERDGDKPPARSLAD